MTQSQLDAIRRRCDAATPGPWEPDVGASGGEDSDLWFARGPMKEFADFKQGEAAVKPDAEFVAHAREDVPALIAEVERLTKVIDAGPEPRP